MIKLARLQDKKIEFIKELSFEEISILTTHMERLFSFNRDTEKFKLFRNTYDDFQELLKSPKIENKLSRVILELMSTFRAFLDHWEAGLKRTFGKESQQVISFKKVTKLEYDNIFAYRFIYELRNYIQHVNMPNLIYHSSLNDNNIVETHLFFDKNELIKNYKKWKSIIKMDFNNLPDTFDFIPLLNDLSESVKRINAVAINFTDLKHLYFSSQELLKMKSYKNQNKCELAIIEGDWDKPMPQKLDIRVLPLDIADYIVKNIKIAITK